MAERTGNAAASTEIIPAGHAAPTADEEQGRPRPAPGLAGLSVAALVFARNRRIVIFLVKILLCSHLQDWPRPQDSQPERW